MRGNPMQERTRQRVGYQPQGFDTGGDQPGSEQQQQSPTGTAANGTAPTPLAMLAARLQASRRISGEGSSAATSAASPPEAGAHVAPSTDSNAPAAPVAQQQTRGLARLPSRRSSFAEASGMVVTTSGPAPVPTAFPMPSLPPVRTTMPAQAAWRTQTASLPQPGGPLAMVPGSEAPYSYNSAAVGSDQAYQVATAAVDAPPGEAPGPLPAPSRFTVYDNPLGADGKAAGAAAGSQAGQQHATNDPTGGGSDGGVRDQDRGWQHSQQKQGGQQQQQQQQQQMVYNADTGLLTRGEGRDHTHVAHHYVEDWSSGQFYELQEQPGCLACCRRQRPLAQRRAESGGDAGEDTGDVIASTLHALERFSYFWADWTGLLGLFLQGLCGGMALMCLFMSYLLYLGSGTNAFLAYYAPLAQNLNRAYFTLVSLSLVASVSKWATDKLAQYAPKALRLRLTDAAATCLYIGAYICNLLATPLDDQLSYEAARDLSFWRMPMQASFRTRLSIWHALNLARIGCCAFAWLLCCYMASPHVTCAVVAARRGAQYTPAGAVPGGPGIEVAGAGQGAAVVRDVQRGQEPGTWQQAVPPVAL